MASLSYASTLSPSSTIDVNQRLEESLVSLGQPTCERDELADAVDEPCLELDDALDEDCRDALDWDATSAAVGEVRLRRKCI